MEATYDHVNAPSEPRDVMPPTTTDAHNTPTAQKAAFGPVHSLLGSALPRLWRYALARADCDTPGRQRRKLRDLIAWLLVKEGYRIRSQVQTPFHVAQRLVRGRLEILVESRTGETLLAIESDWTRNEDSLRKLAAWHHRGVPTLWIAGGEIRREHLYQLRRLANSTLREDTSLWLPIFHLQYGWLRIRLHRPGDDWKKTKSEVTSESQRQIQLPANQSS